jgi:hypothetical protein
MSYPNPVPELDDIQFISVKSEYENLWQGDTQEVCSALRNIQKCPLKKNYAPFYVLLNLDRDDFLEHQILKYIIDKVIIVLILRNEGGLRKNNINYETFLRLLKTKSFERLEIQENKERNERAKDRSLSPEELDEKYDYIKHKLELILEKIEGIITRIKEKHEGKFPK